MALVEIMLDSFYPRSFHDPAHILRRRLSRDPAQRGPYMSSLQMACLRGVCMKALVGSSWEALVSRSCKIRSSSSRFFYEDPVRLS